ncbi:MAG: chloramphenicol phosphotransferase [Gammaproteobacteria bacterium]|nr:chloramphenicol phosphotransferase [Gammaproteobacteria bacterium]
MVKLGRIVILNGAPRSGKSSIANTMCSISGGAWQSIGVDSVLTTTPAEKLPGIGLRPGGERPDLEDFVRQAFIDLYDSVAAFSEQGENVVVDVGHHDSYTRSLGTLRSAARRLDRYPAWLIGVRCPLNVIMQRRDADGGDTYLGTSNYGEIPEPVRRWQTEVHRPGIYDMEMDTSVLTPDECAREILDRLEGDRPPSAMHRLAAGQARS